MEIEVNRTRTKMRSWLILIIIVLVIILLPIFVQSPYFQSIGVFIALYSLAALGVGTLLSYAGRLSMGHGCLYGLGAYTAGILAARCDVNPWLALLAGGLVAAVAALILGRLILGMKGHLFPMSTFALNLIFFEVLNHWVSLTGGGQGFGPIPRLAIGSFQFNNNARMYYLSWAVLAVVVWLFYNIGHSRIGRALKAAHQYLGGSRDGAASSGVNVNLYMNQIFAIGAFFTGIAGGLYAFYITFLSPSPFTFFFSFMLLMMVVIGGWASLWGPLIGTIIMLILSEALSEILSRFSVGAGDYQGVIFGAIFVTILLLSPGGIVQLLNKLRQLARRLKRQA